MYTLGIKRWLSRLHRTHTTDVFYRLRSLTYDHRFWPAVMTAILSAVLFLLIFLILALE